MQAAAEFHTVSTSIWNQAWVRTVRGTNVEGETQLLLLVQRPGLDTTSAHVDCVVIVGVAMLVLHEGVE